MGYVGIHLACGCLRALARKPVRTSLRIYESVLVQVLTSKYNSEFSDQVPQSGFQVDLRIEHSEFSLTHGTGVRDERCSQTSLQLSCNNLRHSECNYCNFHLLIGGRPEIRLGPRYNLLCGEGWTHSVPALAIEETLQSESRSLSAIDIAEVLTQIM